MLDCSVIFGMMSEKMATAYTRRIETSLSLYEERLVPPIFYAELINACWRGERAGVWMPSDTADFLRVLADDILVETADIATRPDEAQKLLTLIRKYQLTAYDGTYLLLALQTGYPLATQDKALAKAATDSGCYFEG